jgi:hypothetical protein
MGIASTLSGFIKGVPPGETLDPAPTDLQKNMPWGDYGGYDTPQQRALANTYGPEYAWGNAGKLQPMVVPPQFDMPGAPSTQQFANTTYQTPWNTGGISGLASGPNSFIPQPTGGGQPMLDLLARQRETYNPLLAGLGQPNVAPTPLPTDPGGDPVKEPIDTPPGGGDGTEDYLDQWWIDNPDYFKDYWEDQAAGQRGEFPFDINDYVTQQQFEDYQSGVPSLDTSNYMTNQQFQDYMGGYTPQMDMSNYMTNQQFQDYMGGYTPQMDMSNYMTNQQFQDYMGGYTPQMDMSNYVTQNQLPDYNQYVTQNSLNTALQGLGSLNTPNPGTVNQPYNSYSYR